MADNLKGGAPLCASAPSMLLARVAGMNRRPRGILVAMMHKVGAGTAVFVLFFGIALIEAFQESNWLLAGLFLALGALSLWADLRKS